MNETLHTMLAFHGGRGAGGIFGLLVIILFIVAIAGLIGRDNKKD